MRTDSGIPTNVQPPDQPLQPRFWGRPTTRLGWWSVVLAGMFVTLFVINLTVFLPAIEETPWRQILLPFYGIFMLSCGLAAGIAGLISVVKRRERSWLVWLTLLPGLMVLFFVLGEFLVPH